MGRGYDYVFKNPHFGLKFKSRKRGKMQKTKKQNVVNSLDQFMLHPRIRKAKSCRIPPPAQEIEDGQIIRLMVCQYCGKGWSKRLVPGLCSECHRRSLRLWQRSRTMGVFEERWVVPKRRKRKLLPQKTTVKRAGIKGLKKGTEKMVKEDKLRNAPYKEKEEIQRLTAAILEPQILMMIEKAKKSDIITYQKAIELGLKFLQFSKKKEIIIADPPPIEYLMGHLNEIIEILLPVIPSQIRPYINKQNIMKALSENFALQLQDGVLGSSSKEGS